MTMSTQLETDATDNGYSNDCDDSLAEVTLLLGGDKDKWNVKDLADATVGTPAKE